MKRVELNTDFSAFLMNASSPFGAVVLLAALCCAPALEAKTVAWYRFEEATGAATKTTVYTNSVDAAKYPMYAGVCDYNSNHMYSKATLKDTAAYMPYATNGFSTVDLTDPRDGACIPNNRSVAVNVRYDAEGAFADDRGNPHAELFVDDAVELRLQTFTLEFFARVPQETIGWRCIFCRAGKAYGGKSETFRLYCNETGRLTSLVFHTLDGDALYDAKGGVTNTVKREVKATVYANYPHVDDDLWHHYAIVVDGAAKTVALYLDYHLQGSTAYTGEIYYEPGYPMCFGGDPNCTYHAFDASYDEIRLSDEVLTTAQMLGHVRKRVAKYRTAVEERTLLYFPFEGAAAAATYGAEMAAGARTYVPYLANQAVAGPFVGIDATVYSYASATNPADPALTADLPGTSSRSGLRGTNALANAQGVHVTTNGVDACDFARPIVVTTTPSVSPRSTATDLYCDDCTFEAFFKAPAAPTPFVIANRNYITLFSLYGPFAVISKQNGDWNSRCMTVNFGDYDLADPSKSSSAQKSAGYFLDGKWHHLALVYDHANKRADFYVDYLWRLGSDVPDFEAKWKNTSAITSLLLGGYSWISPSLCDFRFDDVRVTRGVLRPHEFLTTVPVETDAGTRLARATFDQTNAIGPCADFYKAATKSGTVVLSKTRAGRTVTERTDEVPVNTNNVGSLQFTAGTLTYEGHDVLAAEDQFTVEMFLRADASVAEEGIARINRNVFRATDATNTVTWALAFADGEGHVKVKVDTDDAEGQTVAFGGGSFADGRWHHLGLLFAYDADNAANTRISLYRDGTLVGSAVVTGHVITKPYRMNFMLGAGENGTTNYTGFIDELRISSQAIDPAYFMRVVKSGFTLICR